jgi:hypothetical protein
VFLDTCQGSMDGGDHPSQGLYILRTTQQRNKDKHPCLERDSNPRSRYRVATVTGYNGRDALLLVLNEFCVDSDSHPSNTI